MKITTKNTMRLLIASVALVLFLPLVFINYLLPGDGNPLMLFLVLYAGCYLAVWVKTYPEKIAISNREAIIQYRRKSWLFRNVYKRFLNFKWKGFLHRDKAYIDLKLQLERIILEAKYTQTLTERQARIPYFNLPFVVDRGGQFIAQLENVKQMRETLKPLNEHVTRKREIYDRAVYIKLL